MQLENFRFKANLSLDTIITYWQEVVKSNKEPLSSYAKQLLDEINKDSQLSRQNPDIDYLLQKRDLVEQLVSPIIPRAKDGKEVIALFKPFSMDHFFGTDAFNSLLEKSGGLMNMAMLNSVEDMSCTKTMMAYYAILEEFYGIKPQNQSDLIFQSRTENGLEKYYRLEFDSDYCDIRLKGELPKLSEDDFEFLINNKKNPEVWYEKLPPELFEFSGFGIYALKDATVEQIIASIKEILLTEGNLFNEVVHQLLEQKIKSLLQIPSLKFGFYTLHEHANLDGFSSLIHRVLFDLENGQIPEPINNIMSRIKHSMAPIIIKDTSKSDLFTNYQHLLKEKSKSLLIIPAIQQDELFGVFAFGSKNPGDLNSAKYLQLQEILPLLNLAIRRNIDEVENQIQSVIKQHYTSIHPSVEWKFMESAVDLLNKKNNNEPVIPKEIVFENVYPLFAASDIRNSSIIRNKAITSDLNSHLKMVKTVLNKIKEQIELPVIGELLFKVSKFSGKLRKGMYTGDESNIVHFLRTEVDGFFKTIERDFPELKTLIIDYQKELDPKLKIINDKRKSFEDSLTTLNETISRFLNTEHQKASSIFPHYFEMFKTDGVEYNVYVGQSITKKKNFNKVYLKNMKLWQLLATIEIAKLAEETKNSLSTSLDMTHLILVHSDPLSIRFRLDEKNFDVDGAYNIRYEIVKKRIDKVNVLGTNERLTQPGKIAIVYTKDEDEIEYMEFLEYLKHKGAIGQNIERLQLEELQGVYGLKALRVDVEIGAPSLEKELAALKASS